MVSTQENHWIDPVRVHCMAPPMLAGTRDCDIEIRGIDAIVDLLRYVCTCQYMMVVVII